MLLGDSSYADKAAAMAKGRAVEANNTGTHDVGFMTFGSFGNGIKLWSKSDHGGCKSCSEVSALIAFEQKPMKPS
jgi:hypothetical protein